jgi:putative transposase
LLWGWLCGVWNDWQSSIFVVKAATVIGWHRKGFRLFWAWKVRHGKPGRPSVPKEVRQLIRTMSRENPLWGAPRIHGELLKLGIDIGDEREQVYDPPPEPALPNLADLSRQSREDPGFRRLLYGADDPVPGPVCVPGAGT